MSVSVTVSPLSHSFLVGSKPRMHQPLLSFSSAVLIDVSTASAARQTFAGHSDKQVSWKFKEVRDVNFSVHNAF